MSIQRDSELILSLASQFSTMPTPVMAQRDLAIARMAAALRDGLPHMTAGVGYAGFDWRAEGGGRQANYSPTAWVRIFAREFSPTAMEGFYLVYLFASDGSQLHLSLNQGTSEWRSGHMRPINNASELGARAVEARQALREFEGSEALIDAVLDIDLAAGTVGVGSESRRRTTNYEDANVFAKTYVAGLIPPDERLLADVEGFLPLLASLYRLPSPPRQSVGPRRGGNVETRAPGTRAARQGRIADPEVRRAVEKHAEDAAEAALESDWQVTRVGHLRRGYDLQCRSETAELHVEVKGTQGPGAEVVLTRNEVNHHAIHGGRCDAEHALFVLSGIQVVDTIPPTCTGGIGLLVRPWEPALESLTATEYNYRVPR